MRTNRELNSEELQEVRKSIIKYGPLKASEAYDLRFPRVFHVLTGVNYIDHRDFCDPNFPYYSNRMDEYIEGGLVSSLESPRYYGEIQEEKINEAKDKQERDERYRESLECLRKALLDRESKGKSLSKLQKSILHTTIKISEGLSKSYSQMDSSMKYLFRGDP